MGLGVRQDGGLRESLVFRLLFLLPWEKRTTRFGTGHFDLSWFCKVAVESRQAPLVLCEIAIVKLRCDWLPATWLGLLHLLLFYPDVI